MAILCRFKKFHFSTKVYPPLSFEQVTTIINNMKLSAEIAALIKKHLEGNLSSTDAIELNQWLEEDISHQQFFDKLIQSDELYEDALSYLQLKSDDSEDWLNSLKAKTIQKIDSQKERPLKRRNNWLGYAAAIILLAAISYVFLI